MPFFAKLLALLKPKPTPAAPPPAVADAEFMEAVAKTWRERYQAPPRRPDAFPATRHEQAA